jgi:mono/diheme cytochrome c family protein
MRQTLVLGAVMLAAFNASAAKAGPATNQAPAPSAAVTSGKQTYVAYCASCHGADGRGMGPAASSLKTPPADLTTLAKKHNGKFPDEYVSGIVRFGKPISAHGSGEMPVWGPIFILRDNGSEDAVRRRIRSLCDYLATLQEKES